MVPINHVEINPIIKPGQVFKRFDRGYDIVLDSYIINDSDLRKYQVLSITFSIENLKNILIENPSIKNSLLKISYLKKDENFEYLNCSFDGDLSDEELGELEELIHMPEGKEVRKSLESYNVLTLLHNSKFPFKSLN